MNRRTTTAITTAAVGMAVGTAAYMLVSGDKANAKARTRRIKRTTGKALRQVGDFIDNVSYMMR
ncbi:hypothetical protein U6B65_09785 [Oscillospiraceae bacterium MB08-C2-2]|nr:hypothetical protein U6B65_09785 [Oscillospiraceae bacterium MB08-C2-2]